MHLNFSDLLDPWSLETPVITPAPEARVEWVMGLAVERRVLKGQG